MSASSDDPFALEPRGPGFDAMANSNGFVYWWASDLARFLGYDEPKSFFSGALQRAMQTCMQVGADLMDNIVQATRDVDGKPTKDYKLSRFACYLAAMNGDPKKPGVAKAQVYFAQWAEALRMMIADAENVERVALRGDIAEGEKGLTAAAAQAGVTNFGYFHNAGYRGLYNMSISQLRAHKHIPNGRSPLDFFGKRELAANLFRVEETEHRLKTHGVRGQSAAEKAAHDVGSEVRKVMTKDGGIPPERLPIAKDIRDVKKTLKSTHKGFKLVDKTKPALLAAGAPEEPAPEPLDGFVEDPDDSK